MAQALCCHCGYLFELSPRHKNQTFCKKAKCQKAKKAAWQRQKMKTDTEYQLNQKLSKSKWAQSTPHYWKVYRKNNPEKAERNRVLQTVRNRQAKARRLNAKMDASGLIAKMDSLGALAQIWYQASNIRTPYLCEDKLTPSGLP